ncbi:MAG TPA: response regulator transcription factor [Marmoricola sp.]|nr:response regulator transcription factor [Marmoricola sp.]
MSASTSAPTSPLRLVIADDEPLVRQGLRLVLEHGPGLEVVAEAEDGEQAVALAREHHPDVLLLDVRMPRLDGLEAARRVRADPALGATRVVMLTTFADDALLVRAVRAGASGYLLKSMPPEEIRLAVHHAASGQTTVAPRLVERLLREYAERRVAPSPVLERLTQRETEVLREVAAGRSNAEIAELLYLGEGTVKTHVAALLRKLEVRDRTQAAVAAYELGLVRPGGG